MIEDEGWVSYPLAEYVTGEASKLWKAHEKGRCYGLRDGFCDDTGDASKFCKAFEEGFCEGLRDGLLAYLDQKVC